jgi:hypothetical protein
VNESVRLSVVLVTDRYFFHAHKHGVGSKVGEAGGVDDEGASSSSSVSSGSSGFEPLQQQAPFNAATPEADSGNFHVFIRFLWVPVNNNIVVLLLISGCREFGAAVSVADERLPRRRWGQSGADSGQLRQR